MRRKERERQEELVREAEEHFFRCYPWAEAIRRLEELKQALESRKRKTPAPFDPIHWGVRG